jgi:hypothetical protein
VTEEEEDEEYLKEEEGGLGNTRLVTQPSCKLSFYFGVRMGGNIFYYLTFMVFPTFPFFMSIIAHACIPL